MATDFDWQSDLTALRQKLSEQKKYLDKGLAEIDRERKKAQNRLMDERTKHDLRIKAAREKERRALLAAEQKAAADVRNSFGPPGPVLVSGPDVAGLPRRSKDRGDMGNDTETGN